MIKKTDTQRNGCEECSLDKALAFSKLNVK